MKSSSLLAAVAATLILSWSQDAAFAQAGKGVERVYILNCGEGVAGDISRWSPGVNVGKSMDFVDSCYLIRHRQGWLLWDTGLADAIAAMPEGQRPADPRATHWRRPKTLVSQLDHLAARTHSRPSEPAGQAAEDRRGAAVGRCGALQGQLGQSAGAREQRQPRQERRLPAAHGGCHGEGKGAALDQPRQGATRWPE